MSRSDERGDGTVPAAGVPGRLPRWPAAVVVLATLPAFAPILRQGFVNWDDDASFLRNPYLRESAPAQLRRAWTVAGLGVYQPVASIMLAIQNAIWGLDPHGYHLASLCFHAVNAASLYLLLVALLGRSEPAAGHRDRRAIVLGAAVAAILFAVHPLRVEAVAWASCQPHLPCATFALLSVLAYLRACRGEGRARWLSASWLSLAASLLCRATAVGVAGALVVLDVYPLRRIGPGRWTGPSAGRVWREKLPFLSLAAVIAASAFRIRTADLSSEHREPVQALALPFRVCEAASFYLAKTVWPLGLSAFYTDLGRDRLDRLALWASVLLVAALTVGSVFGRRRFPGASATWAAYLVLLAPRLGVVPSGHTLLADRFGYLASVPLAALLASAFRRFARGGPGRMGLAAAVGAAGMLALSALSWRQCLTWRNSETLWSYARAQNGRSDPIILTNLGAALIGDHRDDEAMRLLREALSLYPQSATAHANLARALERQGRADEALIHRERATRIDPGNGRLQMAAASLLMKLGDHAAASAHFARALRSAPEFAADAHNGLGVTLARRGRYDEARPHYLRALVADPTLAEAHSNLGEVEMRRGDLDRAAAEYVEALRLRPDFADALTNLGGILVRRGRLAEAEARFVAALRIDPGHEVARRGLVFVRQRQESSRSDGPERRPGELRGARPDG